MRVGLIVYDGLERVSGGYLYDRMLVAHLRQQGDQVQVLALPGRKYARHLTDNLSAALLRRLQQARLDVLLQDELNHPSLFWLNRRLRRRAGYPIASIVHHLRSSEAHPAALNRLYGAVERAYLTTVSAFVCNSQATKQAVQGLAGASKPSLVAHPGGDRFGPGLAAAGILVRATEPGPLRLLFLGNLIPRKGLPLLLRALARLPAAAWRLTVVGDDGIDAGHARYVRGLAQQLGLERQVAFLGQLPDAAVASELARHHVLAAPSSYEGFGIVYLEGMGFGLPALASSAGGAAELVQDGLNGFLIAPGDVASLAAKLTLLHENRPLLAEMSLAARRRHQHHPTWETTAAAIRGFLQELV